jgi:Gpi16 subunit, GPI transamidase component
MHSFVILSICAAAYSISVQERIEISHINPVIDISITSTVNLPSNDLSIEGNEFFESWNYFKVEKLTIGITNGIWSKKRFNSQSAHLKLPVGLTVQALIRSETIEKYSLGVIQSQLFRWVSAPSCQPVGSGINSEDMYSAESHLDLFSSSSSKLPRGGVKRRWYSFVTPHENNQSTWITLNLPSTRGCMTSLRKMLITMTPCDRDTGVLSFFLDQKHKSKILQSVWRQVVLTLSSLSPRSTVQMESRLSFIPSVFDHFSLPLPTETFESEFGITNNTDWLLDVPLACRWQSKDMSNVSTVSDLAFSYPWETKLVQAQRQKILEETSMPPLHECIDLNRRNSEIWLGRGAIVTSISSSCAQTLHAYLLTPIPWFLDVDETRVVKIVHSTNYSVERVSVDEMRRATQAAEHRGHPGMITLPLILLPNSEVIIGIPYSMTLLHAEDCPPDTHRGLDVPSGVLIFSKNDASLKDIGEHFVHKVRNPWISLGNLTKDEFSFLYSEPLVVEPLAPDFSMPYNVMTVTMTVLAFFLGSMLNSTARKKVGSLTSNQ